MYRDILGFSNQYHLLIYNDWAHWSDIQLIDWYLTAEEVGQIMGGN